MSSQSTLVDMSTKNTKIPTASSTVPLAALSTTPTTSTTIANASHTPDQLTMFMQWFIGAHGKYSICEKRTRTSVISGPNFSKLRVVVVEIYTATHWYTVSVTGNDWNICSKNSITRALVNSESFGALHQVKSYFDNEIRPFMLSPVTEQLTLLLFMSWFRSTFGQYGRCTQTYNTKQMQLHTQSCVYHFSVTHIKSSNSYKWDIVRAPRTGKQERVSFHSFDLVKSYFVSECRLFTSEQSTDKCLMNEMSRFVAWCAQFNIKCSNVDYTFYENDKRARVYTPSYIVYLSNIDYVSYQWILKKVVTDLQSPIRSDMQTGDMYNFDSFDELISHVYETYHSAHIERIHSRYQQVEKWLCTQSVAYEQIPGNSTDFVVSLGDKYYVLNVDEDGMYSIGYHLTQRGNVRSELHMFSSFDELADFINHLYMNYQQSDHVNIYTERSRGSRVTPYTKERRSRPYERTQRNKC